MKRLMFAVFVLCIVLPDNSLSQGQTEIVKWMYNKKAAVCITYDDASINQFKIAMPLMDERGFPGTFFINTGDIPGSQNQPKFIGRPLEEIIKEAETIPTDQKNFYERASAIRYLQDILRIDVLRDFNQNSTSRLFERGEYEEACQRIDVACEKVRGRTFEPAEHSFRTDLTWEQIRKYADRGHEFACHTISHPYLPFMDEANILYECDKCTEDILTHLGPNHTFSIECPYGIHDERVLGYVYPRYQLSRNGMTEEYVHAIMRGDRQDPGASDKPYVQWQRGALTDTPMATMKEWIDTSVTYNLWLVLVFHGIEGVGWEAKTEDEIREYFDYIKSQEKDVWVATFQDIGKYMRERMNETVSSNVRGDTITVTLSHSLDRNLYTLPLTLRTSVPDSWRDVTVQQGRDRQVLSVSTGENGSNVLYQAVPNAAGITIAQSK